jgi:predicted metalloendopeptidase
LQKFYSYLIFQADIRTYIICSAASLMMKALIWVLLIGLTLAIPAPEAETTFDVDEAKQPIDDVINKSADMSDESGSDESGSDESGSDESGSDESGSDESGSDESGSDESGHTSEDSADTSEESGDTSEESNDTSEESTDTSEESETETTTTPPDLEPDQEGADQEAADQPDEESSDKNESFYAKSADKVLKTKDICLTRQCIEVSNRLFDNMKEEADPCEDFNEFACGRFETETIIPDDKGSYGSFSSVAKIVQERGRKLIEAEIDEKNDFDAYKKAKIYYKSCMNEVKQEKHGVEPVKKILAEIGGWPVMDGDKWSDLWFDLWAVSAMLEKNGFSSSYVASNFISSDSKNSSWRVIQFDQTSFGLSREYLVKGFEEKEVQAYFK